MNLSAAMASMLWALAPTASPPGAPCTALEVSFTTDCLRQPGDAGCVFHADAPDFGPQIAVWVERGDGTFVDTLMVTNATAIFGIGNRPGDWNLRSGPRFPYGRREMALPVWAHARGKTYPLVVMQDGQEDRLGGHEDDSSPEPHFCRPMLPPEIVDAVTCPSGTFRSDKGKLDPTAVSVYPPRADLFDSGALCPPIIVDRGTSCDDGDSAQYGFLNDVDVVAAATPPFGVETSRSWILPAALAPGPYAVLVEVGKEYDPDDAHRSPSLPPADVPDYGAPGNLGQPSVIFRVPFAVGGAGAGGQAAAAHIDGTGDPTGATGAVLPPDGTISTAPGSGEGRLATTAGPGGMGRVHVSFSACEPFDCASHGPPPAVPVEAPTAGVSATAATVRLHQVGDGDLPVLGYEARFARVGSTADVALTAQDFARWTPVPGFAPAAPDTTTDVTLDGLAPQTEYAVGVVAHGRCGDSPISYARFTTPVLKYVQLKGCFVATAAFGSPLAAEVNALRVARDRAAAASGLARAAVDLYDRAGPAAARVLAGSDVARAVVRRSLAPIAAVSAALARP
ncbi:MAG TPA: CFI-box-CTERM domain-containing protein [Polyangia bacterium]|nr:CFI-box-CTERM domain-containing protein [Polyangia bacterium]